MQTFIALTYGLIFPALIFLSLYLILEIIPACYDSEHIEKHTSSWISPYYLVSNRIWSELLWNPFKVLNFKNLDCDCILVVPEILLQKPGKKSGH